jgi:hypothetical protein
MARHPGGRVLHEIERELTVSDPHLAALLRVFTILAKDQRMPRAERIRRGPLRLLSRPRRRDRPGQPGPRRPRQRRAGEGWPTALLAAFSGSLALGVVTYAGLSYGLGTGYPRHW